VHCIQGSEGAELHPSLVVKPEYFNVKKGLRMEVDCYSCFFNTDGLPLILPSGRTLDKELKSRQITDVYCVGVATDYCVAWSAREAAKLGYHVYVVEDGCRATSKENLAKERVELVRLGVTFINSSQLDSMLYLQKHNIPELFYDLCSSMMSQEPLDARTFLIKQLKRKQRERIGLSPDDDDNDEVIDEGGESAPTQEPATTLGTQIEQSAKEGSLTTQGPPASVLMMQAMADKQGALTKQPSPKQPPAPSLLRSATEPASY